MKAYKIKFRNITIYNRWKSPKYSRRGDWVVFGLSRWYASVYTFKLQIALFGFDICFWFDRIFK